LPALRNPCRSGKHGKREQVARVVFGSRRGPIWDLANSGRSFIGPSLPALTVPTLGDWFIRVDIDTIEVCAPAYPHTINGSNLVGNKEVVRFIGPAGQRETSVSTCRLLHRNEYSLHCSKEEAQNRIEPLAEVVPNAFEHNSLLFLR